MLFFNNSCGGCVEANNLMSRNKKKEEFQKIYI